MKINIYKENEIFYWLTGERNPLAAFFINRNSINDFTITPNVVDNNRNFLKYSFDGKNNIVDIDNIIAEAILNNYRVEFLKDYPNNIVDHM
jgi:hypothetical protein